MADVASFTPGPLLQRVIDREYRQRHDLVVAALCDHRLGSATGKPWYQRPDKSRMPKTYQQTYACKCKAWEGTHGEHVEHVADAVLALLTSSIVVSDTPEEKQ